MRRAWLAIARLAASWMFGVGYFLGPNWWAWGIVTAAGLVLLLDAPVPMPESRSGLLLIAAMLLPAVLVAPAPYRWPPLIIAVGIVLWNAGAFPSLASALIVGGVVMLVQGLTLVVYGMATARSHELPEPLPQVIAAVAKRVVIVSGLLQSDDPAGYARRVKHLLGQIGDS